MPILIDLQGTRKVSSRVLSFTTTTHDKFVTLKLIQKDRYGSENVINLYMPASALAWAENVAAALNASMEPVQTQEPALASVQPGHE